MSSLNVITNSMALGVVIFVPDATSVTTASTESNAVTAYCQDNATIIMPLDSERIDEISPSEGSPAEKLEKRRRQIDALALKGPKKPKSKDSWKNTVGKYTEDSPLVRIMEEGEKIRESKRIEEC